MFKLSDFDYQLPDQAIAQDPITRRADSKMLVFDRKKNQITHHSFSELPELIDSSFVIVRNNTKVIPARLFGRKSTGGIVEILLSTKDTFHPHIWQCLTKPGIKVGTKLSFPNSALTAECIEDQGYTKLLRFSLSERALEHELDNIGQTPLPPYITKHLTEKLVRNRYQTIYAKPQGSVAAPTAGLHFTPAIDRALSAKDVKILELTLHVGLGTFLPVKTDDITKHVMHAELYELSQEVANQINQAKKQGKKILAVGTTTLRVLESCADESGVLRAKTGETKLYVYPPHKFKVVDALLTNFHFPKSTLLMLVAAFTSWPNTQYKFPTWSSGTIGHAYKEALAHKYRFLSFGDCMLIR